MHLALKLQPYGTEQGTDLLVVRGQSDPFLKNQVLRRSIEPRSDFLRDLICVFGCVETDDQIGDPATWRRWLDKLHGANLQLRHFATAQIANPLSGQSG